MKIQENNCEKTTSEKFFIEKYIECREIIIIVQGETQFDCFFCIVEAILS